MNHIITGLPDATGLLDHPAALRLEAEREGFLFFPALIPPGEVLSLRHSMLEELDRHHYLLKGTGLMEGIGDVKTIQAAWDKGEIKRGVGASLEAYADIQKLEAFHALAHHPALLTLFGKLFGEEVFPHPRNIARLMLPREQQTPTPPHQDYIHIQGTQQVWTAWIPVGDCPRTLGGLSVLRASHKQGIMPVKKAEGAGGLEVYLCGEDYQWIEHDYQAGDVLIFHSLTVHKALPNHQEDRIRLSCDFRYQPASMEIEAKSLKTHYDVLPWEAVYRDWNDVSLCYYWKKKELRFAGWDESIRDHQDDIC
jgi:hypothetical protein